MALVLAVALATYGCGHRGPTYVSQETVTDDKALAAFPVGDYVGAVKGKPSREGAKLRVEYGERLLDQCEAAGDDREGLSRALATVVPADSKKLGVPVYAARTRYEGRSGWLIVEAWGTETGKLDKTRLWVVSADGKTVLVAISARNR